jgi:hypothetical protein
MLRIVMAQIILLIVGHFVSRAMPRARRSRPEHTIGGGAADNGHGF